MKYFAMIPLLIACRSDSKISVEPDDVVPQNTDVDGDGYTGDEDCDESNGLIHIDAEEGCDGVDNNCNGEIDEGVKSLFYSDADGDGYGSAEATLESCEAPLGYVPNGSDCDDSNAEIYPGADEICDGLDNDCNDTIDDGQGEFLYVDADGDGFGDANNQVEACELRDGLSAVAGDCDDSSADISPSATEVCDDVDNNCDGSIDEGLGDFYYPDGDGDGYGDPEGGLQACSIPEGYLLDDSDCDDVNSEINPSAIEVCDEVDNDCNGLVDTEDPNLTDSLTWYLDYDGDGFGDQNFSLSACTGPSNYVSNADDCDDLSNQVSPNSTEVCDDIDNNCDGLIDEGVQNTWYLDYDGDGYGNDSYPQLACAQPTGFVAQGGDCNDGSGSTYPGAEEYCDAIDQDCDGDTEDDESVDADAWYVDDDGDTYGDPDQVTYACSIPAGYVDNDDDCDDSLADVFPGSHATEIPFDGIDQDCDGEDVCHDLNCDAWPDVVVPSYYGTNGYASPSLALYGGSNGFSGSSADSFLAEGASGVTTYDLNADGYLDIIFSTYYSPVDGYDALTPIFWGSSTGFDSANVSYLDSYATHESEVCIADLNGDGYAEIVIPHYYSQAGYVATSYLYWGSANGYDSANRTDLPASSPLGCLIEDFDQDGYQDIFLPAYSGPTYQSHLYWGSASMVYDENARSSISAYYIRHPSAVDMDQDGKPEILVPYEDGYAGVISSNSRVLDIEMIYHYHSYDMEAADLDNDGDMDLIMCQFDDGTDYNTTSAVYWNSNGSFGTTISYLPTYACHDVQVFDGNQDGHLDLLFVHIYEDSFAAADYDTTSIIYYGSVNGFDVNSRDELVSYGSHNATVVDVNLDGYPDITLSNYYDGSSYDVDSVVYYGSANGYNASSADYLPSTGVWGKIHIAGAE